MNGTYFMVTRHHFIENTLYIVCWC